MAQHASLGRLCSSIFLLLLSLAASATANSKPSQLTESELKILGEAVASWQAYSGETSSSVAQVNGATGSGSRTGFSPNQPGPATSVDQHKVKDVAAGTRGRPQGAKPSLQSVQNVTENGAIDLSTTTCIGNRCFCEVYSLTAVNQNTCGRPSNCVSSCSSTNALCTTTVFCSQPCPSDSTASTWVVGTWSKTSINPNSYGPSATVSLSIGFIPVGFSQVSSFTMGWWSGTLTNTNQISTTIASIDACTATEKQWDISGVPVSNDFSVVLVASPSTRSIISLDRPASVTNFVCSNFPPFWLFQSSSHEGSSSDSSSVGPIAGAAAGAVVVIAAVVIICCCCRRRRHAKVPSTAEAFPMLGVTSTQSQTQQQKQNAYPTYPTPTMAYTPTANPPTQFYAGGAGYPNTNPTMNPKVVNMQPEGAAYPNPAPYPNQYSNPNAPINPAMSGEGASTGYPNPNIMAYPPQQRGSYPPQQRGGW